MRILVLINLGSLRFAGEDPINMVFENVCVCVCVCVYLLPYCESVYLPHVMFHRRASSSFVLCKLDK